jgi:predicted transcriptional regulator
MMKRITFSLDEELKRKLESRAQADRRSVSNLINICLEKYLPKIEKDISALTQFEGEQNRS